MPLKRTSEVLSDPSTDDEIDNECDSEVDSASSDEEDQLEVDESLYDDELLASDFLVSMVSTSIYVWSRMFRKQIDRLFFYLLSIIYVILSKFLFLIGFTSQF